MTGFTLIWFNSCQLWAPSRCLFFSGHLDRFGPDNAQLLEIFLDISHQWGSGVLYQKCLFPGTGSSGELHSADVTHLLPYRIHIQHKYTAHFEICNTFHFCLTLFPDLLLGTRLWVPVVEIIYSHLVRDDHFVMATATCPDAGGGHIQVRDADGFNAGARRLLEDLNKWTEAQRQVEAPSMNTSASKLLWCFNAVAYISSTGNRSF